MDQLSEKWKETQDILDKAAESLETMMNVAECLQRAGEECVRRNELIATALIGPASRECQERDIKSEKWRKFLFERNYPVEFVTEPRWYQILKSYRPSRSMYDGLGMHTRQKITMVDVAVQTDSTSVNMFWCGEVGACQK
ncbi:uncharacterized protein LOC117339787 [Pecten maximus]|uniref:uncharacterized protein LOC117339787 n=1 Tax=Pecten maximus TaxID=6579 RepID=UPI001457EE4C|nr:uncharacterized protein LOC117339787 [Pecten maximus]